ncbi:hypothetical protein, partial [Verminephrobacter aporrectodeae]|uniref:hypothetical protein n=1 Tax=Verminephrobacter aporrectodeae TaxID=1110389 RepID=UPI0022448C55
PALACRADARQDFGIPGNSLPLRFDASVQAFIALSGFGCSLVWNRGRQAQRGYRCACCLRNTEGIAS